MIYKLAFFLLMLPYAIDANSLNDLLTSAKQNNHKITAAQFQYESVGEKVAIESWLPDPQFKLGVALQPIETRLGEQSQSLSLSQKIPMWGKRGLYADKQRSLLAIEQAKLNNVRATVLGTVLINWWELAALDYEIAKTIEYQRLVSAQLEVAQAGYSSGGDYSDIIDVKLANDILADFIEELKSKRIPLVSKLNSLAVMNGNIETNWEHLNPVVPDLSSLKSELSQVPELMAVKGASEVAEKDVLIAGKRKFPDLTVGVDWVSIDKRDIEMPDNGTDAVIARVGFNLPIWSKKNGAVEKSASAYLSSVKFLEDNKKLELEAELVSLVEECRSALRRYNLYSDNLIPEALEAVMVIRSLYESGHASFADLVASQKRVLDYELHFSKACLDGRTTLAKINIILGELPEGI